MPEIETPPNAWEEFDSELLRDLLRQSQDALIVRDFAGAILYMNPAAETLYGFTIDEAIGQNVHDLFQNQFAEGRSRYEADLLRDGYWAGEIAQRRRNGTDIVVSSRQTLRRGRDGENDIVLASNRDISEQHHAARRLQRLFDSHVVGVIYWNLDTGQITDANDHFLAMVGYTREDLVAGKLNFRAMTPPEWTERNEEGILSIRTQGSAPTYEKEYFRKDGSRVPILIGGTRFEESRAEGFSFIIDNSERKLQDARERARDERERARLTAIFMHAPAFMAILRGPQHICEIANPPYFELLSHRDILGKPVALALPEVQRQGFIDLLDGVYRTGVPFVGNDVPIMLQTEPDGPLQEHLLDFTYQPLFEDDGAVWGILVHGVDQTERRRLELQTQRLLEEQHRRLEREALLNHIRATVRSAVEPDDILNTAVSALGQGVQADRCYFVRYSQARDSGLIAHEWLNEAAGLQPVAGLSLQMSAYTVNRARDYTEGDPQVVYEGEESLSDDFTSRTVLNIRALIKVPFDIGTQGMALVASMAEPRDWTDEEVRMVEDVAILVQSALEAAYVQQRERNIAQTLQDALVPTPPPNMPGLSLAHFYRPALTEAGVGGDWHDTFSIDENCTALVVGDLSGKGLHAASQVGLVRNMLRFALYNSRSVADAVTTLNQTLVEHDLLTGFATLFVGLFDHAEQTLTYVNCGQEPGLIYRATSGEVDQLGPTGPILGGFIAGGFEQNIVKLTEGDSIAIFTDGCTEVGPNRRQLLGIEGVTELFRSFYTESTETIHAATIVKFLITSVDEFARGGIGDDIALLVGIVGITDPSDDKASR